jgi:CheY-like chemotaxis protein
MTNTAGVKIPNLLIVEDEPQQRETLNTLFTAEGYSVRATDSAEKAMELLKSDRPDLVVTDVKLLGMDGISFFEEVRRGEARNPIPFIFMTAYNDLAAIERVKSFGSVEYITKPFDLEKLISLVRSRSRKS